MLFFTEQERNQLIRKSIHVVGEGNQVYLSLLARYIQNTRINVEHAIHKCIFEILRTNTRRRARPPLTQENTR